MGRLGIIEAEASQRRRRPAELEIEDIDEQQPGEEHRQRYARGRDHAAGMVDQRALLDCGENAERHRDQHRDDEPHQGKFRRRRQTPILQTDRRQPAQPLSPRKPSDQSELTP